MSWIGIGLAFVKLALTSGARVIIADLALSPAAEPLVRNDPNVRFIKCDVQEWDNLEALIPFSEKEFGDVPDVYAANAGVGEPVSDIPFVSFSWSDSSRNGQVSGVTVRLRDMPSSTSTSVTPLNSVASQSGRASERTRKASSSSHHPSQESMAISRRLSTLQASTERLDLSRVWPKLKLKPRSKLSESVLGKCL